MNKQTITFTASEQTLTKTGGIEHYASNTVSYVQAVFDLGENWAGFDSVRAVFKTPYKTKPAVLDHSGRCLVPFEVLKYKCKVLVNLVGSISEEGVLTDRLTSYPIEALTIDANASVDNSETAISPTEFEEFVAIVSDDADRAEAGATASEASADNAEASAESALASAQASEASAIRASNSASDASASAQTAQEEAQKITGMVVVVTQLPEGATPTSDWSGGVLTIGIPKGDTGETGATGNGIESAVLNADYTLTLTFTDGTSYTTPSIRGATGATGATGNGISSVTLTSTSGAVKTYTIAFTDGTNTTFDVTDGEVTQAVLDETVADLKSELTNEGVVQGSQGLVSDSKISDSVPYLFRQTADGTRVGNVVEEEIVGGTVAWNQLMQNGNFESSSGWGADFATTSFADNVLTMAPSEADRINFGVRGMNLLQTRQVIGHKYLVTAEIKTSVACEIQLLMYNIGTYTTIPANAWTNKAHIYNLTSITQNYTARINAYKSDKFATSDVVQVRNYQVFDLTQMFGTTIADYLYSLETATAGAGIALFKKLFPKPYYEYNAGELKSVGGLVSHDMTGFNQWDEEWRNGLYGSNNNGAFVSNASYVANKNAIGILPSTTYYFRISPTTTAGRDLFFYDGDGNYISKTSYYSNAVFTTPSNAHYMNFNLGAGYGATYNHDICINISGSRNGQYEPYVKRTYALDSTLTLRGIPKLSDGKIYYDGDVYESDGTVNRKYGIVDLGTLTWKSNGDNKVYAEMPSKKSGSQNIIADGFVLVPSSTDTGVLVNGQIKAYSNSNAITLFLTGINASNASTMLSGKYLVYELATPTTETAEPYTSPQIVDRLGTEEYVTTGIVPIGHNSKYSEDLKGKIEELPWDFSTLIAPTETAYKATRNYTSGSLLIVSNTLYKATANIQSGGTITPNTNVVATTLAEVIASL